MTGERIKKSIELCAPAGNLPSLREAVDNGADAVYLGFNNDSNLRNFPGLNFNLEEVRQGIKYARKKRKKIYITVNSYPQHKELKDCYWAIDQAVSLSADAVIVSDLAVLSYIKKNYPGFRIHLSVQAGASNHHAIKFYEDHFGIKRLVLPRILTMDEIKDLRGRTDIELEIFVLGLLCINCEGKCFLSSYITGESINTYGACSSTRFLQFTEGDRMRVSLNKVVLNEYGKSEAMAYPTPCKSRYHNLVTGQKGYALQDPESLSILKIFRELSECGIDAIKIEGRQRSAAYAAKSTAVLRRALNGHEDGDDELRGFFEGMEPGYGCYLNK